MAEESSPKKKKIGIKILIGIGIILLNLVAGFYIGRSYGHGRFTPWVPLGKPPEPAVSFYHGFYYISYDEPYGFHYEIFVESETGTIYRYIDNFPIGEWVEYSRDKIVDPDNFRCLGGLEPTVKPPSGVIDEYVTKFCSSTGEDQENYVLLENGSIWRWKNHSGIISAAAFFYGLIFSTLILLCIEIGYLFLFVLPRKDISKTRKILGKIGGFIGALLYLFSIVTLVFPESIRHVFIPLIRVNLYVFRLLGIW